MMFMVFRSPLLSDFGQNGIPLPPAPGERPTAAPFEPLASRLLVLRAVTDLGAASFL